MRGIGAVFTHSGVNAGAFSSQYDSSSTVRESDEMKWDGLAEAATAQRQHSRKVGNAKS
jgi:hypothetical protein